MKIAIAQTNPTIGDIKGNTIKITDYIDKASQNNADLIIFPKMAITGYPVMDLIREHKLIDENLKALEIISHYGNTAIICGYIDKDKDKDVLLNCAAFIYKGEIIAKYTKPIDSINEYKQNLNSVLFKNKKIYLTIEEDYTNLESNTDFIIDISAQHFRKGNYDIKLNHLSKTAKKLNTSIIYVNQVGANDNLIFDGGSLFVNSKGDPVFQADKFCESIYFFETENKKIEIKPSNEIEDIRQALVLGIRDYCSKCGFKQTLLGLSGGIDSAITAVLAVEALGSENVLSVTMPSMYSSKGSVDDSIALAKNLDMELITIPIKSLYDEYLQTLESIFDELEPSIEMQGIVSDRLEPDLTEENLQSRIRGTLLMAISNKTGKLLLSTGNKSELYTGYCTLYGDMCGGLAVLGDLYKTTIYELAKHINKDKEIIPNAIIEKAPSAELRPNQKDQDTLPPYEILDAVLEFYIEENLSVEEIIKKGFDSKTVLEILKAVNSSEHKRRQAALALNVTSAANRKTPIANKYEL